MTSSATAGGVRTAPCPLCGRVMDLKSFAQHAPMCMRGGSFFYTHPVIDSECEGDENIFSHSSSSASDNKGAASASASGSAAGARGGPRRSVPGGGTTSRPPIHKAGSFSGSDKSTPGQSIPAAAASNSSRTSTFSGASTPSSTSTSTDYSSKTPTPSGAKPPQPTSTTASGSSKDSSKDGGGGFRRASSSGGGPSGAGFTGGFPKAAWGAGSSPSSAPHTHSSHAHTHSSHAHTHSGTSRLERGRRVMGEGWDVFVGVLLQSGKEVTYGDVPWVGVLPQGPSGMPMEDMVQLNDLGLDVAASQDEIKKALRVAVLRWHPDKFQQQFGQVLCPGDAERILERVTAIASSLNRLRKLLVPS